MKYQSLLAHTDCCYHIVCVGTDRSFEAVLDPTDHSMLCVDIGTNLVELQVGVVGVKIGAHRIEPYSSSSRMRTDAVV